MTSTNKDKEIKIGSIVSLKSHPYQFSKDKEQSSQHEIKILAYAHFTPPLMVVIGCKKGTKYNSETGELENNSYLTLFYNSKKGKHEENWFKEIELKLVSDPKEPEEKLSDKSLSALKEEWVGKQATLTSVDLELGKVQLYKDNDLKEKSLLDFLPPMGTIISISEQKQHKMFHDKTGKLTLEKSRFMGKLRYYNNYSHKMSEEDVPLSALMVVTRKEEDLPYKKDKLYWNRNLEGMLNVEKTKLERIPLKFLDTVFKHYYYEYRFENIFTGKLISIRKEKESEKLLKDSVEDKGLLKLYEEESFKPLLTSEFSDEEFWVKKWFCIKYLDKRGRYTTRLVYVLEKDSYKDSFTKDRHYIKAICLLRNGAERHFYIGNIVAVKEVDMGECLKDEKQLDDD